MPNFVKIGQSFAKILRYFDFSRWRLPSSWIVEFAKFYWLTVFGGGIRITVPDFIKIIFFCCRDIAIFKMAAGTILDFLNREILLAIGLGRVETHQCAKFHWNRSFRCGDISIFWILKMAAAAMLDFWNREIFLVVRLRRVETHPSVKFCQNLTISCEDIKIFRFLKMAAAVILDF